MDTFMPRKYPKNKCCSNCAFNGTWASDDCLVFCVQEKMAVPKEYHCTNYVDIKLEIEAYENAHSKVFHKFQKKIEKKRK